MRTRSSASTGKRSVKETGKRNKLLRRTGDFVGTSSTVGGNPASFDVGSPSLLSTGNDELKISPSVFVEQTIPLKPATVTKRRRKLAKAGGDQVATVEKHETVSLRMIKRKDEQGHRVKAERMKSIARRKKCAADKGTGLNAGGIDLRQNCVVIRLDPMDVKSCSSDSPFEDNPDTTVSGLFTLHLNSQAKTLQLPLSMDPKDVEHLLGNVYRGRQTNAIIETVLPSGHLGMGPFTSPPPKRVEATISPTANPPKLTCELVTPPAHSASTPSTVQHTGFFPPPTLESVPTAGGGIPVNGEGGCCSPAMEMTPLSSPKTPIMRINQVDCRVRTGRAHFPIKKRLSVHYKQFACRSEDSPSDEASPIGCPPPPLSQQGMPLNPSAVPLPSPSIASTGGAPPPPPPPPRVCLPALENLILPRPPLPPQTMMLMMSNGVTLSSPVGDGHEASKRLAIVLPVNFLSPAAVNGSLTLQHQPQLTANQLIFVPQVGSHPTGGVAVLPSVAQVLGPGPGDLGGKRAAPTCRVTNSLTAPIPASLVVPSGLGEVPMQTADSRTSLFGEVDKVAGEVRNQPMDCLPPVATVNGIDNLLAADRYLNYCSSISTDASSISATELSTSSLEVTPAPPLLPVAVQPPLAVVQSTGAPVGDYNPTGKQNKCQSGNEVPASTVCHQLMPCLFGQSPMSMVGQSPSNLISQPPVSIVSQSPSNKIGQSAMSMTRPPGKNTSRRRGPTANNTTGTVRAGRFRCQECGMACLKACLLRKHIRTHYDVRPYMCQYCNIAFKTRGNLSKHMKSRCHMERCSKDPSKGPAYPIGSTTDSIQIDTRALEKQRLLALSRELVPEVKRPAGARYRSIRACPKPSVPENKEEEDSELAYEQQPATIALVTTATAASPRIPAPNVNVVHLQQELPLNLSVRPTQPTILLEYTQKEAIVDKSTGLPSLLPPPAPSSILGKATVGNGIPLETATPVSQQRQLTPVSPAETIIRSAVAAAIQSTNIIRQTPDPHPTTSQCTSFKVMTIGAASPSSDGGTPCATWSCFTPSPLTTSQSIDAAGDPGSNPCLNPSLSPVVEGSARLERRPKERRARPLVETSPPGEEEKREPRPYKCSACRVGFRVTGHLHKHYRAKSHLLTVLQANNLPTEVGADNQLSPSDLIDPETGLLKETVVVVDERLAGQQQRMVVGARDGV